MSITHTDVTATPVNGADLNTADMNITVSLFPTVSPAGPALGQMRSITWGKFATYFLKRRLGSKDGPVFIPAAFKREPDGRVRQLLANVVARTAIALDIETNKQTGEIPPRFCDVVANIKNNGWAAVIYTSHNHRPDAPRYRIVLPLSREISPALPVSEVIAEQLNLTGVLDTSKIGPASPFYFPSTEEHFEQHEVELIDGCPVGAAYMEELAGSILAAREAERAALRAEAMKAAEPRRRDREKAGYDADASIIEAIRDRLDLAQELIRHGYKPMPGSRGRYLYPGSQTGVPGVYLMSGGDGIERVYSHHSGDPLAAGNLPSWCRTKAVDVVDVVTILDFSGDLKTALRELAKRFDIKTQQKHQEQQQAATGGAPVPDDVFFDPWAELVPPPFPIDTLPPVLRSFAEDRARVSGADPCAIAWASLSACSAALNGSIRLRMKKHDLWSVPPAIWVALVGRSATTMKTPTIEAAWSPLLRAQHVDLADYRLKHAAWKALPRKERDAIEEPHPRRRLVSHDGTMEALQDILGRQDRGVGVLRDELSGWLGSLEKYGGQKAASADRAFFLQAFNGGPNVVDRVTRKMIAIENLLVTICGGIQPERLQQFANLSDDGLWQRFVAIIVADAARGQDQPPGPAVANYHAAVNSMLEVRGGIQVGLCDAAHEIRADVEARLFDLVQSNVLGPRFASFCGKLPGIWGRLCIVLNYLDPTPGGSLIVSHTTAKRAEQLLFCSVIPSAARVYAVTGGTGEDAEATQSVAGYILAKHKDRVLASDLARNVRVCRGQPLQRVQAVVSPLVAGGWLVPEKEWNPFGWVVSPGVHIQFAARASREAARRAAIHEMFKGAQHDGEAE